MQHFFGLSDYQLRQRGQEVPVIYDPSVLINGHLMLCGASGTGKTHQSIRLLKAAAYNGVKVDIFDVHEELNVIPGCSAVKYSQATGYGYNPLVLDVDPHSGGVNKQADFIVGLVKQVTTQFGSKQEAALRNLIIDTYMSKGIFADNPKSWVRDIVSEEERSRLISERQWEALRHCYPTLTDLLDYAERKVLTLMFGSDNKAMASLEALCKQNMHLQSLNQGYRRAATEDERKKLESKIKAAEERCITLYTEAVRGTPGREVKDLIKYDSRDVLISVIQRLQILNASGIFRANPPPFTSDFKVHQIKSLSEEQSILFTKLRLREIFEENKKLGPTPTGTELRHIAFLEEAPRYFTEEKDDIINIIAREARKFGLGLWCAAQQPTSFPESFLTNCGAKIILGIDPYYWKGSASKLRITEDTLRFIKPKQTIAVRLQKEGEADPSFNNVVVPNPKYDSGRQVIDYAKRQRDQLMKAKAA